MLPTARILEHMLSFSNNSLTQNYVLLLLLL
jgi:hypothetical protein